jgi:hypothetical protein
MMWRIVMLGAAAIVVAIAAYMVFRIGPRNVLGMIRYDRRRAGDLAVGDRAPDVTLVRLDGTAGARLLDGMEGRPRVIVFGSFT